MKIEAQGGSGAPRTMTTNGGEAATIKHRRTEPAIDL
jgi:hypothetical protein